MNRKIACKSIFFIYHLYSMISTDKSISALHAAPASEQNKMRLILYKSAASFIINDDFLEMGNYT
ncbi:hypothetical protein GGR06_003147 [Bacteroides reticulotermitis]|uniref:Uncharacterized protein n=2 Tax=Bacteroides reticulotermitis TaxID=1133319 RepID=W4UU84_9BACE|nr:hypothetical protein [Bacteroides reticulotermitis]GAE84183.1 hypothetical protein JCM10512_2509 [Bacteroides reticulotermitis JCM 10512]